ncbi:sulfate ABC transporter permease subunit CysT [Paenibacillus sacheonensis]|uniref:Sulfate transport system permease protein CysT n=1 Tax=Paenibacillus sacheonensis TaxID=742054 RepID=A0A7X4YQK7_9BACL|nr:sulfate ABC transporter permease subunit CysT [Paenibacillus sacheonensis]MBM7567453.1 sulfate transport system permease protein [Paenibacillus sacheonensis]NBC69764.1 sulfate ABC transporter permease subunit CysT [Paenibacillus sacheonensis]
MTSSPKKKAKPRSVLPGFGLSLGFTVFYLSIIVIIPLIGIFVKTSGLTPGQFWDTVSNARVVASYKISFLTSFYAALINLVFGLLIAWVLVRYQFPGKKIIDSLIDMPFALPTAVAGISLTAIYAPNGWVGQLLEPLGIKVAFTPLGITLALIFIGLPFVVRTVQPVLQDLDNEVEEAAVMLGAFRWSTFRRVVLPELIPPLLTGFALAFARGIGEYGSVVFISGNMPMKTEIAPLLIMTKLEQFDYRGATAIALVMLVASFLLLLLINYLQWRSNRRVVSA